MHVGFRGVVEMEIMSQQNIMLRGADWCLRRDADDASLNMSGKL